MRYLILFAVCSLPLAGCAAPDCSNPLTSTFSVTPTTATADHVAKPPGNQAQFRPQLKTTYPAGCLLPVVRVIEDAIWTTSDSTNVQIDSTIGTTNGLATCAGTTDGTATITAKLPSATNALSGSASLTCQ